MFVVVSANGEGLDAPVSPVFGRCPVYVFVDTETMQFTNVPNPAANASGGAGIQAAQLVIDEGAQAVISANVGPNALQVMQAANVPIFAATGGTVREAVEAFKEGTLPSLTSSTSPGHVAPPIGGQGSAGGLGSFGGRGGGQGMGKGLGGGQGMGGGLGKGRGRGRAR